MAANTCVQRALGMGIVAVFHSFSDFCASFYGFFLLFCASQVTLVMCFRSELRPETQKFLRFGLTGGYQPAISFLLKEIA